MLFHRALLAPTVLLTLAAAPAAAQVRVGVHIDIPIIGGRDRPVVVRRPAPPPRIIVVDDYSSRRYGKWQKDARKWDVVTLWWYDGHYYERPMPRAREVRVYRYHDQYFRAPQEREWFEYRDRQFRNDDDRNDRDGRWFDPRDDRRDDRRDSRDDNRRDDGRDGRWDDRGPQRPMPPQPPRNERARPRPN